MAISALLKGKRVYLDTNVFIYIFEDYPEYQSIVQTLLEAIATGEIIAVSSDLALGELLVAPFKKQQEIAAQHYIQALNDPDFVKLVSSNQAAHIEAARVRALTGMKYPDALHVAIASLSNCDIFLTNDQGVKVIGDLQHVLLADI